MKSQSTDSCTEVHRTVLPMNIVTPLQFEDQCQPSTLTLTHQWHRMWTLARHRFSKLAPGRLGRWSPGFRWRVGSGMCRWARCSCQWGRAGRAGCHPCALWWRGSCRFLACTSAPLLQSNQPEIQRGFKWQSRINIKLSLKITTSNSDHLYWRNQTLFYYWFKW